MTSNISGMQSYIGWGKSEDREQDDFYATPDRAIDALLARETFSGLIWEPACGDGAISKKLKSHGYDVFSSDLYDRGYGVTGMDFLRQTTKVVPNIITNPPFKLGTKFTEHALNCVTEKVAIFNKLTFLEGKERRDRLFSRKMLKTVYVFSERVPFQKGSADNTKKAGGMLAFAWFIFEKSFKGDPTIKFI